MHRRTLLGATPALLAMSSPDALDAQALATLHQHIDAALSARALPGAALWVERLGQAPHRALFGQRAWEPSPEPLTDDAVFDVASLTKPVVTGALCALLIERGALALDDPASRHLAEFATNPAITLRHLLTHSSGLPAILPLEPAWRGADAALALACAAAPTDPPGRVFRYSDVNYVLLGVLLERVAGLGLAELARREVLEPLGMGASGFLPLARHPRERLVPTEFDGPTMLRGEVHDPAARRMGGVAGHAGLFAPIAEIAAFARATLGSPRWARMARNASPPGLPARGLGWDIDSTYSRPRGRVFPRGAGWGHTGYTGCAMWIDPGSRSFYVFLSNRVHPRGAPSIVALYEEVGTWAARSVGLR